MSPCVSQKRMGLLLENLNVGIEWQLITEEDVRSWSGDQNFQSNCEATRGLQEVRFKRERDSATLELHFKRRCSSFTASQVSSKRSYQFTRFFRRRRGKN